MGLFDFDEEYFDDEIAEEANLLTRARKMGIPDSPELRRFIGERDSFSISDEELLERFGKD